MFIKKLTRDITPPIIWRIGSKSYRFVLATLNKKESWQYGIEQPPEYYDEKISPGTSWFNHYTSSGYYPIWTVIADRIRRYNPKKILDIGCGPGQMASLLRDQGIPCYLGVDFSSVGIKQARKVCPEYEFVVADVFETDFLETHSYDCLLVMEFLEHVERDIDLLQKTKPGTFVLATVPNFPAGGHVRYFNSIEEVKKRYKPYFESLQVDEIRSCNNGKARFYIVEGVV